METVCTIKTHTHKKEKMPLDLGRITPIYIYFFVGAINASCFPTVLSHLGFPLDGVHSADELAVGLEEQQQLKVQLVQAATQLELLRTHKNGKGGEVRKM